MSTTRDREFVAEFMEGEGGNACITELILYLIMPTSKFRVSTKPAVQGDGTGPTTHEFRVDLGSGAGRVSGESRCLCDGKGALTRH